MKYLIQSFFLLTFFNPFLLVSQKVTTLANVTANGGVTLDAEGNLFVAHFGPLPFVTGQEGKNIYKITPSGEVSLFVDGQLNVGSGNHIDSQGFLYQSNFLFGKIFKINDNGDIVDNDFATIAGPVGITIIENDTLVVCECNTNSLKKIAPDGSLQNFISSNLFNCANGITQDDEGIIYTTNFSDGRVNRVTKNGEISTIGSTPTGNGHIAFRSLDQHLYIASYSGNRIYKMDLNGEVSLFAGTGLPGALDSVDPLLATFTKPNGIEISIDGCSLYITQDENVIREIKLNDNGCITSINDLESKPNIHLYPNPTRGKLYYDDNGINIEEIQIFDNLGRLLSDNDVINASFIDMSNFYTGIYLIQFLSTDKKVYTKRIALE